MLRFAILILGLLITVVGCGGGGESGESREPTGVFSTSFIPDSSSDFDRLDIDVTFDEKGNLSTLLGMLSGPISVEFCASAEGTGRTGFIDLDLHFLSFGTIEIEAEFTGLRWEGIYRKVVGGKVVEEGSLTVVRRNPGFLDISGTWDGTFETTAGSGTGTKGPWTFDVNNEGNDLALVGAVNNVAAEGSGTIIGNRLEFSTSWDVSGIRWRANVVEDKMTGTWFDTKTSDSGTFEAFKQN